VTAVAVAGTLILVGAGCSDDDDSGSSDTTDTTSSETGTASRLVDDVSALASDAKRGRDNGTAGSTRAQEYLIGQLETFADGLDPSRDGAESFKQPFTDGTNLLAVIPGTDLSDEYVIVGAHYDHVGSDCPSDDPADTICNGATDNAAGVAEVLAIGREIASNGPPRRSVVLALWDREEDGLLGSEFYVQQPLVPLAQTVAYVNFDIQGSNLLPTLRSLTFALGAETGGEQLTSLVTAAIDSGPLDAKQASAIFGQGRSDYVSFTAVGIPIVFFTDATGPCYHTAQDDIDVVDFSKLGSQVGISMRLVDDLAATDDPPEFSPSTPIANFDDALTVQYFVTNAIDDRGPFAEPAQSQLVDFSATLDAIVAAGAAEFGDDDVSTLLSGALTLVTALTTQECDGFMEDA
jgi:hypothetical protein